MKILFGVSSGVSLYKGLTVIRMLVKAGHSVKVIMTPNAAKMVSPLLFKTLSKNEVYVKDFNITDPLAHIKLSDWGDVFAVCPATANTMAKLANGLADNLLTSSFLAFNRRRVVFPAMNVKMLENPITQENIEKLRSGGMEIIDPCFGDLACGYTGRGRLPPEDAIFHIIERTSERLLEGKKYIVSAGGTIEMIDPVRYLSNSSSGKMGIEIASALYRNGAGVLLVYGNISVKVPEYIKSIKALTAAEMLEAIDMNMASFDGLFMAAAPADFRPSAVSQAKIKSGGQLEIKFVKNPDILKNITEKHSGKIYIGFALETENYEAGAQKKLLEKGLTYIALNGISGDFNPLGNDSNDITLISKIGPVKKSGLLPKSKLADWLIAETLGIAG